MADADLDALNAETAAMSSGDADLAALNAETSAMNERFVDKIPGLNWVNKNVFEPVSGKLGEIAGAAANLNADEIKRQALDEMYKEGKISKEERNSGKRVEPGIAAKARLGGDIFLQNAFDSLKVKDGAIAGERPEPNADILAYAQAADKSGMSLSAINAAAMAKGVAYLWDDNNADKLQRWGTYLNLGGQAVARGALTALEGIGAMPRKDAIELLSQTNVSMSDLVDHYWIPTTAYGKIARGLVGFAADANLDPLSYIGRIPGAAMRLAMEGGPLRVGNRLITNAAQLSRVERQSLIAAGESFDVIRRNGSITKNQADEAINLIRGSLESGPGAMDGRLIDDLVAINPELGQQVQGIVRSRQTEKGFLRSIADGDTSVGLGFRIPMTRKIVEQEIPLFGRGTRWGAQAALGVKDWAFDSAARTVGATVSMVDSQMPKTAAFMRNALEDGAKVGNKLAIGFGQFKTFTTRPLWDFASNNFVNAKYGNQSFALREISEAVKEVGSDPDTNKLMVDWLEQMPTHSDEYLTKKFGLSRLDIGDEPSYSRDSYFSDAGEHPSVTEFRKTEKFKELVENKKQGIRRAVLEKQISRGEITDISGLNNIDNMLQGATPSMWAKKEKFVTPIVPTEKTKRFVQAKSDLAAARQLADQTMAQLRLKNPKAADRVIKIREQLNSRMAEMEKRGIPFKALNPFDQTIPVNERAMGYFPHILNPDYAEDAANGYAKMMDAFDEGLGGMVDKTQAGRRDRRNLFTINESIKKANGIEQPLFVNDPITAAYQRIEDMDNLIAQHEMFRTIFPLARVQIISPKLKGIIAKKEFGRGNVEANLANAVIEQNPGRGWVEFDVSKFSNKRLSSNGAVIDSKITDDLRAKELMSFESFLPNEYKLALKEGLASKEGAKIFFPEDVATRIEYILQKPKSGTARSALDAFNFMFRNTALFGLGYQGQNAFTNMTTYMNAGADLSQMGRMASFLINARTNSAKVRDRILTFGKGESQISMTGEEFFNLASSKGILSNSTVNEADFAHDMWDQIATTKSTRDKLNYKVKDTLDTMSLFKLNRAAAEQNDNIFRLSLFADSLEKGYTVDGARERVGTYFYDFRDTPKGQRIASQIVPFSSFGMKTVESVVGRAKKLDLTPVTLPYHVRNIMNGAYVDSYEDRKFLDDNVPFWAQDQAWGPGLPGARQLRIQAPFVISSAKAFFNPQDSVHPLVGLLAFGGLAASAGENPQDKNFEAVQMDSPSFTSEADRYFGKLVYGLIPPSIRLPITIAQMQSPDDVRALPLDFVSRYKTGITSKAIQSGSIDLSKNAADFGRYLREEVSPDWLYNSIMFGSFKRPDNATDDTMRDRDIMYGNFVKSRFRDMTLGLVNIDSMDRMIMMRMVSAQKTIGDIDKKKKQFLLESHLLIDPNAEMKEKIGSDGLAAYRSLIAEQVEIKDRIAALKSFYGYYISQKKSGGTFIDEIGNIIYPKEHPFRSAIDLFGPQKDEPLTTDEAVGLNVRREKINSLEFGRKSDFVRDSMKNFNSGLSGE